MAFILGTKLGMTHFFAEDGSAIPVTVIGVEENVVTQVKTEDKDGYTAVQIGAGSKKKIKKPMAGHLKDLPQVRHTQEFRDVKDLNRGDKLDVSVFNVGDKVKVTGIMKGKGFQGAVKRHGFKGMPASHGHRAVQRHVGSIGQRFPQHTLKGVRMAGRMGGVQRTTRGLKVVNIDKENGILAVKGAVPGNNGALLRIETLNK
jgi:large subunit ribosomal protein L3